MGDLMNGNSSLSSLAIRLATELGCDTAFCLTGGMAMHLNWDLSHEPQLTTHFCHHESCAVAAAEGYSKSYDLSRAGLAVITSGPAVTNAITGLASAYGDGVPVLVLAGQVKTSDLNDGTFRTLGVQEVDQIGLASRVTKYAARLTPQNSRDVLFNAREALSTGRLGPVFLEIPLDVQSARGQMAPPPTRNSRTIKPLPLPIEYHRPLVMLGNGLRSNSSRLEGALNALRQRHVHRLYTWTSFDLEEHGREGNLGCPGLLAPEYANWALTHADLILFLGVRLDRATTAFSPAKFGAQARRIAIDIDPSELTKLKPTEMATAIVGDAFDYLEQALSQGLKGSRNWYAECNDRKQEGLRQEDYRLESNDFTVRSIALEVSRACQDCFIVPASSGIAEEIFTRFLRPASGTKFFNGAALGSMGLGLAHGLGAATGAGRDGRVWVFEGDGGIWMNVQELATVSKVSPPGLCIFVLNNDGYASIRNSQRRGFDYEFGASHDSGILVPSLEGTCEELRLPFQRITSQSELRELLPSLEANSPPRVVELCVANSELMGPRIPTKIIDGKPESGDIGDLSW